MPSTIQPEASDGWSGTGSAMSPAAAAPTSRWSTAMVSARWAKSERRAQTTSTGQAPLRSATAVASEVLLLAMRSADIISSVPASCGPVRSSAVIVRSHAVCTPSVSKSQANAISRMAQWVRKGLFPKIAESTERAAGSAASARARRAVSGGASEAASSQRSYASSAAAGFAGGGRAPVSAIVSPAIGVKRVSPPVNRPTEIVRSVVPGQAGSGRP